MKKLLTIIIPIFQPTKIQLLNIEELVINNEFVNFLVLSDNPKLNYLSDRIKCNFVKSKKNVGKLNLIVKNISHVETVFFKVLDPDDFIDHTKLPLLVKKLQKYSELNVTIKHNSIVTHDIKDCRYDEYLLLK